MPLIRYPGSKEKLAKEIIRIFPQESRLRLWSEATPWEYREPFFGAGAVGFEVLESLSPQCRIWLNDLDPGMAGLWQAVRESPRELANRVMQFVPAAEWFYEHKHVDLSQMSAVDAGFIKLALHRISYSGLGSKAGGPLGGRDQTNAKYDVACRWRPEVMYRTIMALHRKMWRFEGLNVTCQDFRSTIEHAPEKCMMYVDPPYYEKGESLYQFSMSAQDHEDLATLLRQSAANWVLSYDDHPAIRDLYSWAFIQPVNITYTISNKDTGGRRPKNQEIAIMPPR